MPLGWIVAGLGNPGREYVGTRHDLGFALADRLAAAWRVSFSRDGDCDVGGPVTPSGLEESVLLAKPRLYMNRSGPPLARVMRNRGIEPARLLVACDDVNIPLGRLRLRPDGSAGGHNGLKSIIESIGYGFPRLRLGVGAGPQGRDLADYVLARFAPDERDDAADMLERAAGFVPDILRLGVAAAVAKVPNPRPPKPAREQAEGD